MRVCTSVLIIGSGPNDVLITDSRPQGINAWRVWADNTGTTDRLVAAYAVCMTTES